MCLRSGMPSSPNLRCSAVRCMPHRYQYAVALRWSIPKRTMGEQMGLTSEMRGVRLF